MTGQYSYPPPDGQGTSPSGSNMALPSINLPPIRNLDGSQQAPPLQQQQGAQAPMVSAMPPAINQYYGQQGQPFQATSDPNAPQRWPIAPDGRVMSGGRHKKEIKRRTKTGCLTCRKRRIKCDEAHPACRNCQKSKRECLGYDPIFKTQPGPTAIQPAISGGPPLQPGSANSSPYPPPPSGYMHAGSHGYAQVGPNSENSTAESYDYSAAIDPALEGEGAASMQDSKGALGADDSYAQDGAEQHGPRGSSVLTSSQSLNLANVILAAKRTKIEELLCLRGYPPPPPAPPSQLPPATREELKHIWITVYAPAIDKFLETRWFVLRGLNFLMANDRLCDQFATLLTRFTMAPNPSDPYAHHQYYITQSLEATIIWAMMGLCRQVASTPKPESGEGDSSDIKDGVLDAAKRLEVFEALVTGEYLDADSAPLEPDAESSSNGTPLDNQLKSREREFWRLVHTFLTIRDDEASAAKEIDDTLMSCRSRLDGRENRDVVYSIIIARHVGARVAEFPNNLQQPESDDEMDNRNKLVVAKKFIEDQRDRGTNQVVQRMCGMAAKSWSLKR